MAKKTLPKDATESRIQEILKEEFGSGAVVKTVKRVSFHQGVEAFGSIKTLTEKQAYMYRTAQDDIFVISKVTHEKYIAFKTNIIVAVLAGSVTVS